MLTKRFMLSFHFMLMRPSFYQQHFICMSWQHYSWCLLKQEYRSACCQLYKTMGECNTIRSNHLSFPVCEMCVADAEKGYKVSRIAAATHRRRCRGQQTNLVANNIAGCLIIDVCCRERQMEATRSVAQQRRAEEDAEEDRIEEEARQQRLAEEEAARQAEEARIKVGQAHGASVMYLWHCSVIRYPVHNRLTKGWPLGPGKG